jgi:hypothetical protein
MAPAQPKTGTEIEPHFGCLDFREAGLQKSNIQGISVADVECCKHSVLP